MKLLVAKTCLQATPDQLIEAVGDWLETATQDEIHLWMKRGLIPATSNGGIVIEPTSIREARYVKQHYWELVCRALAES